MYIYIYIYTVKTNVARLFLRLLNKHFPRLHILRDLFKQNTIKVSYIVVWKT